MIWLVAALVLSAQPAPATGLAGAYDPQNPFAKFLRGEVIPPVVYDDSQVLVFVPRDWQAPGHLLIIPKRSVRNLLEMTPEEMRDVMIAVRRAALAQVRALGATGFQVTQNNGISSSQHVYHVHFHVIPSYGHENRPEDFRPRVSDQEKTEMAARLREAWPKE